MAADLQLLLSGLARHLFGETEQKMVEDSFPFTSPSFELEVPWFESYVGHVCLYVCLYGAGPPSGSLARGAGLRSDTQTSAGQRRPGSGGSLRMRE